MENSFDFLKRSSVQIGQKISPGVYILEFLYSQLMGLYHPLDGDTNLKYKLLCFLTHNKKVQRERH